jgi:hypothetical protein
MIEEYFHIMLDPAHAFAEISYTILFDLVIVGLIWGVIFNKIILPKVKRDLHLEIDTEHGIVHTEPSNVKILKERG